MYLSEYEALLSLTLNVLIDLKIRGGSVHWPNIINHGAYVEVHLIHCHLVYKKATKNAISKDDTPINHVLTLPDLLSSLGKYKIFVEITYWVFAKFIAFLYWLLYLFQQTRYTTKIAFLRRWAWLLGFYYHLPIYTTAYCPSGNKHKSQHKESSTCSRIEPGTCAYLWSEGKHGTTTLNLIWTIFKVMR